MTIEVLDDNNIRKLVPEERFLICEDILKNINDDESKRWDAVWLAGEMAREDHKPVISDTLRKKIGDLMAWVIYHDDNDIVGHEACFQITGRNYREHIPALIYAADSEKKGVLTRHEALESLGLMRATEAISLAEKLSSHEIDGVKDTAKFILKRLKRLENAGAFIPDED